MLRKVLVLCGVFMLLAVSAVAIDYVYLRSFSTDPAPGPLAVDTNPTATDCYYATFGQATSTVYYVPDFLTSTGTGDQRLIAGPIAFATLRGFQGIALDSSDNVFVSGDNGGGSPVGIFQKYVPNIDKTVWTLDGTFNPDNTVRYAGCALLTDARIVVSRTLFPPQVLLTSNGSVVGDLPADTSFGREPTFNPDNNDIYQGFNGLGVGTNTLEIYKDGDPANIGNYTLDLTALFADSVGTVARNHNAYDKDNDELLHVDTQVNDIEIYSVNTAVRGAAAIDLTPVQTIDLDGLIPGAFAFDVVHTKVGGVDYLLVSDYGANTQIHVFKRPPLGVKNWMLYY